MDWLDELFGPSPPIACKFCKAMEAREVECKKHGADETHKHYSCSECGFVFTEYFNLDVVICLGPPGYGTLAARDAAARKKKP